MNLEIGTAVRYQGLGSGRVTDHVQRPFRGKEQKFAVILFPHRSMTAQIPMEDEQIQDKLFPVYSKSSLHKLVGTMDSAGEVLPRTWDHRGEVGKRQLSQGGPEEWMKLIASYSLAERHGVSLSSSDYGLIHQALELFASELACAEDSDYKEVFADLENRYDRLSEPAGPIEEGVHFASPQIVKQAKKNARLATA